MRQWIEDGDDATNPICCREKFDIDKRRNKYHAGEKSRIILGRHVLCQRDAHCCSEGLSKYDNARRRDIGFFHGPLRKSDGIDQKPFF